MVLMQDLPLNLSLLLFVNPPPYIRQFRNYVDADVLLSRPAVLFSTEDLVAGAHVGLIAYGSTIFQVPEELFICAASQFFQTPYQLQKETLRFFDDCAYFLP